MSKLKIVFVIAVGPNGVDGQWVLGQAVPGEEHTEIAKMCLVDGIVEVFVMPKTGSPMFNLQQGMVFKLMPLNVKLIGSTANFADMQALMDEAEAAQDAEYEDEEEEEEYEEVPAQASDGSNGAPQLTPAASPQLNGQPST